MTVPAHSYWGCNFQWWRNLLELLELTDIKPNEWNCGHHSCNEICPLYNMRGIDGRRL